MGKLVRDRIPDIIRAEGREPRIRILTNDEYVAALLVKVVEEAGELRDAATTEERLAEAADVYEVLLAVAELCGASIEDVVRLADAKRQQRGGFGGRVWLE
ncbi:nucleoside triphosphate pyrophosphohydrolase [Kineococcus sp. NPDC059986]|jgi:predicted house-cleaning noncanonical NTP pyrophosphatase (MazG superfamily)|uniref:nucleoside triphosphate pyrophosphohydrolase n=1 Tax=Kineococcus sp. NPDC059986 TaxID=3155538 RepID=UPI003450F7D2